MSYSDDLDWLARNVHEWPEHTPHIVADGDSLFEFGAVFGWNHVRINLEDNSGKIIFRSSWRKKRAELQNKPSWKDAPEWAEWLAQDADGEWGWHEAKPIKQGSTFYSEDCGHARYGEALGDWRDTLEKRPDTNKNHEEIDTSAERAQKTPESVHVGHKADHGKPIIGAIPPHAELAVARVLTFGAEKYARDAWQSVENAEVRYMDAALRHLNAHRRGGLVDDESGESHLAHAACCIMFLLDAQEREGGSNE